MYVSLVKLKDKSGVYYTEGYLPEDTKDRFIPQDTESAYEVEKIAFVEEHSDEYNMICAFGGEPKKLVARVTITPIKWEVEHE